MYDFIRSDVHMSVVRLSASLHCVNSRASFFSASYLAVSACIIVSRAGTVYAGSKITIFRWYAMLVVELW